MRLFAVFVVLGHTGWAEEFLVEDGQPRAEIVIAEKPARMARFAASELQHYLEKISGAKLPIVTAPTAAAKAIYVGRSAATERLQLKTEGLAQGAYRVASGPAWLALLGLDEDYVPTEPWGRNRSAQETQRVNAAFDQVSGGTYFDPFRDLFARYDQQLALWEFDDAGTLNAVYDFLRSLGVRWYAPGELGEVVPKQRSIALPQGTRTVRPDFPLRRLSYFSDHLGLGDKAVWNLRLGVNPGHKLIGATQPGHGIKFVLMREENKQAHPEMYALTKGRPNTLHKGSGAPCLASPKLMAEQLRYARAIFDHYREPMLSIDMVDGYGGLGCEHPQCRQQLTPERGWASSMSNYVWGYVNRVATELHRSHPDRLVSGLAYSAYQMPPENTDRLSPNLVVVQCRHRSLQGEAEVQAADRTVREAWLSKLPSKKLANWDYYIAARPEQAGRPVVYPHLIARDLRELKGVVMGESIEVYQHPPGQEAKFGYDPLALEHLNLYVTTRLWWDSSQDVEALLEDYYTLYYGPARTQMKALLEYAEAHWPRMGQDAGKVAEVLKLLEAAQQAAEPSSVYGQRIAKLAALMKPLHTLQKQLSRPREGGQEFRVLEAVRAGGKSMLGKPLDGQLTAEYWPAVRFEPLRPLGARKKGQAATEVRIFREAGMLYWGVRCAEPEMAQLKIATTTSGDPKLLEGDYVTFLVETPSRSFYEIAVNPAGAVLELDHGPEAPDAWTSGAQVAVHRGEGFWSVEMRLPIVGEGARAIDPAKGIDGARPTQLYPWYINVGRQRVRGTARELAALAPAGAEDFRVAEKFVKLWGR